ncbi:hypothetical protein [Metabacillus sediminilitoris]|uniref:hypothetical protein n=1 Tax=Metabacillus sediminilitoris TaxID=2567941 RepID=UPI001F3F6A25|nr:hypothetical protein [Metabacillus sediminilitoris]
MKQFPLVMIAHSKEDSEEEISYRKWCVENNLFLNTLNDALPYSVSATDIT